MKSEQEVLKLLDDIKKDERLTYKSADIFTNAPLALIQLSMESQIHTLETILELPFSKFPLPKNQ